MLASNAGLGTMASNFAFQRLLPLTGLLALPDAINFFKPGYGSALDTGGTDLSSIASGAMIGAGIGGAIGSIVPGFGTLIGMGIGAGVGAIADPAVAAFMSIFGIDSHQERATKRFIKDLHGTRNTNMALSGVNAFNRNGRTLFNQTNEGLGLYLAAVEAAARTGDGGDTEEFKKFMRFMGKDPNKHHLDNAFAHLQETGFGGELAQNLENMQTRETNMLTQAMRGAQLAIDSFETSIVITTIVIIIIPCDIM